MAGMNKNTRAALETLRQAAPKYYDVNIDLERPVTQADVDQWTVMLRQAQMFRSMAKLLLTPKQVREINSICEAEQPFALFDHFKTEHAAPTDDARPN